MIKVWTDAAEAGLLDRHGERGSTFAYLPGRPAARRYPLRCRCALPSWSVPFGLPPIFEMNLPEGVLRERLRLAFAKATGTFDEFDLLSSRRPLAGRPHPLYRRQGAAARGRAVSVGR